MLWGLLANSCCHEVPQTSPAVQSFSFKPLPRIKKLIDTSSFVAVNLYAKSIFGEDATTRELTMVEGSLVTTPRVRL